MSDPIGHTPKHTPGPWKIGEPPPNGEQTIGTQNGLMVAVATTGVDMAEVTLANARLIAAAPDLLAALQDLLSSWQDICKRNHYLHGPKWDSAQIAAVNAILKATGAPTSNTPAGTDTP